MNFFEIEISGLANGKRVIDRTVHDYKPVGSNSLACNYTYHSSTNANQTPGPEWPKRPCGYETQTHYYEEEK